MCKFYAFLYRLIPVKTFQSFLIRKHFSRCLRCEREFLDESRVQEILIMPKSVEAKENVWPEIRRRIYARREKKSELKAKLRFIPSTKWKWAFAASFFLLVVFISVTGINYFLLEKKGIGNISVGYKKNVFVESATIQGKPAKLYFYQPKNRKMSVVWVGPNLR